MKCEIYCELKWCFWCWEVLSVRPVLMVKSCGTGGQPLPHRDLREKARCLALCHLSCFVKGHLTNTLTYFWEASCVNVKIFVCCFFSYTKAQWLSNPLLHVMHKSHRRDDWLVWCYSFDMSTRRLHTSDHCSPSAHGPSEATLWLCAPHQEWSVTGHLVEKPEFDLIFFFKIKWKT